MQSLGSVTAANLTAQGRRIVPKFEAYIGSAWVNLTTYLVKDSLSVSPSGAGRTTEVICGSWSAEFWNTDGEFNPFHTTSAYTSYFRIGRLVRISLGIEVAGVTTYWQVLNGYMDAPKFTGQTVQVSGTDYLKALADTALHEPYLNWGTHQHFTSVATGGTGTELYDEADACEIGAGEADSVASWSVGGGSTPATVESVAGYSSTFAMLLTRGETSSTAQYAHDSNIVTLAAGQTYILSFKGLVTAGTNYARVAAYETVGGSPKFLAQRMVTAFTDETEYSFQFTATTSSALQLRVMIDTPAAAAGDAVRIDQVSVKTYDPTTWYKYQMAADCRGVYAVTVAGEFVAHGDEDVLRRQTGAAESTGGGWHYDVSSNTMCFSETMQITAGLDVIAYYYQTQTPEDVIADLLVAGHLYSTRALAKAAMDYEATGIALERVYFDAGTSALEAARMLCERANYRFWVTGPGVFSFRPGDALGATADFTFSSIAQLGKGTALTQDLETVANRVTIEGEEKTILPATADKPSKWSGESEDATSIDLYLERTRAISNRLFQDQDSVDDMCDELVAEFKDPKWYVEVAVPFCATPFEIGDSVTLQVPLTPQTSVEKKAVIRAMEISVAETRLNCEVDPDYSSPDVPKTPDIGAVEYQGGGEEPPPPVTGTPDIGAVEYQGD